MIKLQDNLKQNPIAKSNIETKNKSGLSFSGHSLILDDEGFKAYRFYLPAGYTLGKGKDEAQIKFVEITKNSETGEYKDEKEIKPQKPIKIGKNFVDYKIMDLGVTENSNAAVGYKFVINGKDYLDSTLLTPNRKWNIAIPANRPVLEEARSMYHLMPDLMLSQKTIRENPGIYDDRRNHFNRLGGSIEGIRENISYIEKLGARRILSTPIFGQDNISNHGYWTTNPYQVSDELGNIADFKRLNLDLYKRGMALIADGAFVNEGLEGMHMEHITKFGTKSPYLNWLNLKDYSDQPLKFGVLSKKDKIQKYTGIKLVNAPYKLVVDKNGKETVTNNDKFDSSQPSYVQIYDKRLASREQINNSQKIIRSYANKDSKDQHEINDYMDAVIPYRFRINPDEAGKNPKKWTTWKNFEIVPSPDDGGSTLWVGNKDIAKLRFMFTEQDREQIGDNKKADKIEQSVCQVQDNIVQVGKYWTNEIARTVHTHTAKAIAEKMKGQPKNAASYKKAIDALADPKISSDKREIPVAASKATEASIIRELKNKKGEFINGRSNLKTAPVPETIEEGLMELPFDAVEFNSSVCGVLGSPYLKKLASTKDQIPMSRYEMYSDQNSKEYKDLPEEYRQTYGKMDDLISGKMKDTAVDILERVDEKRKVKILDDNDELTDDGKELYALVSNDMAKFIVSQALIKAAGKNIKPDYENNKDCLAYKPKALNKISAESLELSTNSPKEEAESMIKRLETGIEMLQDDENAKDAFAKHLAGRLEGLDGNTVRVAKLVTDRAEGGLEWRIDASKDVCPVEEIMEKVYNEDGKPVAAKKDFEDCWKEAIGFWTHFTGGVRKYNPRAYEILEITDEKELTESNPEEQRKYYKDREVTSFRMIQESGATTPSNYNFFYSPPSELYNSNTEFLAQRNNIGDIITNLLCAWNTPGQVWSTLGHLHTNSLDTANQSHNSVGNQDKPRAHHLFAMNPETFFNKGKGAAMGEALTESFNKAFEDNKTPKPAQKAVLQAVDNLSQGKYHIIDKKGNLVEKKMEDGYSGNPAGDFFGVRPFDINIRDVIKEAKLTSPKAFGKDTDTTKLEKDTLVHVLKPALKKYRAVVGLLAALPGNPTIYAGDELGESGFEMKCKNPYVQNRNHNHYNRASENANNPEYIKEIAESKKEIAKIMNLKRQEAFSPMVNGATVALNTKEDGKGDPEIVGMYRYNEKTDMFVLLNKKGFGYGRENAGLKEGETVSVPHIDLSKETTLNYETAQGTIGNENGILKGLQEGTVYKDTNTKAGENTEYRIVKENGKTLLKKFVDGKPVDIEMTGPDLFLYRKKDFSGKTQNLSFNGNSKVVLANTKYNIGNLSGRKV